MNSKRNRHWRDQRPLRKPEFIFGKCPKCTGDLYKQYEKDFRCLQCGHHYTKELLQVRHKVEDIEYE